MRDINRFRNGRAQGGGRPHGNNRVVDSYGRHIREMNESRHADGGYVNEGLSRELRDAEVPARVVIQSLKKGGGADPYSKDIKRKLSQGDLDVDTKLPAFSLPMPVYEDDDYYTFMEAVDSYMYKAQTALVCTHSGVVLILMDTHKANTTTPGLKEHGGWFGVRQYANDRPNTFLLSITGDGLARGFKKASLTLNEDMIYVIGAHSVDDFVPNP